MQNQNKPSKQGPDQRRKPEKAPSPPPRTTHSDSSGDAKKGKSVKVPESDIAGVQRPPADS